MEDAYTIDRKRTQQHFTDLEAMVSERTQLRDQGKSTGRVDYRIKGILESLKNDMKSAMKARDKMRLGTIRMLLSAVKNEEIQKKRDLDESEELALLTRQAKQRRESIEAFSAGGRAELAERERAELAIIKAYLPPELTEAEVQTMIRRWL